MLLLRAFVKMREDFAAIFQTGTESISLQSAARYSCPFA
jgi:hypothetical protein